MCHESLRFKRSLNPKHRGFRQAAQGVGSKGFWGFPELDAFVGVVGTG